MTKETTTMIERLDDDPAVRTLRERLAALMRESEAADKARARLRPAGHSGGLPFSLEYLQADAAVKALDQQIAGLNREIAGAARVAQERIVAARRPGRVEALARLRDAAQAALDAANALFVFDAATAGACELAPPAAPAPSLLMLADTIRHLTREIEGPVPEAPAPPPRPGEVRVRLLIDSLHHRERMQFYLKGDVFDLGERDARDLLKRGAVVEVA